MKKNFLLLAALVLASLAIWFGLSRRNSTISKEDLRFAVLDTAMVERIFLADRQGRSITLQRTSAQTWIVNDSFPARADLLKSLLEAVSRVQVKTRVSKAGYNNVLKALATDGIKCEIYTSHGSEPEMVYYVGGPTPDQLGTFMMKEGADQPFICEIPGFNGYLTPRYSTKSAEWRDKLIYSFQSEEIREVRMHYPAQPGWSFFLRRADVGFLVGDPLGSGETVAADTTAAFNYLYLFRKVAFESEALKMRPEEQDSLARTIAVAELMVIDTTGKQHGLRLYPMPVQVGSIATHDSLGNPLKHDVDRFYANDPMQSKWWIMQHFTFDPVLRKRADFLPVEKK